MGVGKKKNPQAEKKIMSKIAKSRMQVLGLTFGDHLTRSPFAAAHSLGGLAPTGSPFTSPLLGAELQQNLALGPSLAPLALNEVCVLSTLVHLPGWPSSPPLA